jgi:hypothetical protein
MSNDSIGRSRSVSRAAMAATEFQANQDAAEALPVKAELLLTSNHIGIQGPLRQINMLADP